MRSFLVAVTNPKGYIFCSALLPQFIDPAAAQAPLRTPDVIFVPTVKPPPEQSVEKPPTSSNSTLDVVRRGKSRAPGALHLSVPQVERRETMAKIDQALLVFVQN